MHEKREFFRLRNTGDIQASYGPHALDVVEISSSGVAIIKKNIYIQKEGIIELKFNHVCVHVKYELLRIELKTMVLVFKNQEDIDTLFTILKRLKEDHHP
ncbi:MAG: PilZ domain-containing protein [Legionella sp.]|nr:MAG: PilZ domain-containing protein [Legionella sp.]